MEIISYDRVYWETCRMTDVVEVLLYGRTHPLLQCSDGGIFGAPRASLCVQEGFVSVGAAARR